jgi:hypothetical protein
MHLTLLVDLLIDHATRHNKSPNFNNATRSLRRPQELGHTFLVRVAALHFVQSRWRTLSFGERFWPSCDKPGCAQHAVTRMEV